MVCSAFLFSSALVISGVLGVEVSQQEQRQNGSTPVGGGSAQSPELKSIEHNIEEQCIQNCGEQVNQGEMFCFSHADVEESEAISSTEKRIYPAKLKALLAN